MKDAAFSSDTGMGEVLLIAKKLKEKINGRGRFVSLYERPKSILDAMNVGKCIISETTPDKLETGRGGTTLSIGKTQIGHMLDCPLGYSWKFVNVVDPYLEQIAHQITAGVSSHKKLPTTIDDMFKIGPHALDIIGNNMRGPFNKISMAGNPRYPALWNNKQSDQTKIVVPPDVKLEPRKGATEDHINTVWNTASHVHVNINPRFTSNSLIASYTIKKTVGGRSWPSLIMEKKFEKPFVIWCNSTFGILEFWSLVGKQQLGRGMTSRKAVLELQIPDFSDMKIPLADLSKTFDKYKNARLDKMKNLWRDETRINIDTDIQRLLKIKTKIGMDDLRRRLCQEPSISGGNPDKGLLSSQI